MFEERREREEWENQGERESRPALQKGFFWSFRNFCLLFAASLLRHHQSQRLVLQHAMSLLLLLLPLPPFFSLPFFSLIRYSSPRECICVSAEKLCIVCSRFDVLMTTWRANYAQRFPPFTLILSLFRFQQLHLAFPISPHWQQAGGMQWKKMLVFDQTKQQAWKNLFHISKGLSQFQLCIPMPVFYLDSIEPCCLFSVFLYVVVEGG